MLGFVVFCKSNLQVISLLRLLGGSYTDLHLHFVVLFYCVKQFKVLSEKKQAQRLMATLLDSVVFIVCLPKDLLCNCYTHPCIRKSANKNINNNDIIVHRYVNLYSVSSCGIS